MTTVAQGNFSQIYVPVTQSLTFTPGEGGYIDFGCASPVGNNPDPRRIYAEATIAIPAGSIVDVFAGGADATHTDPVVASGSTATDNIWTAAGSLVVGTGAGAAEELLVGQPAQVLRINGSGDGLEWANDSTGSVATDTIWDAAGDLAVGIGPDSAERLAKGTALQYLRVNSGGTGLEWASLSSTSTADAATTYSSKANFEAAAGSGLLTTGRLYRFTGNAGWLAYATAADDYIYLSAPTENINWGRGAWADRPVVGSNPALAAGDTYTVSDIGNCGDILCFYDGTNWKPINGEARVWRMGTEVAILAATVAETAIGTSLTVPAGLIHDVNCGFRVTISAEHANDADDLAINIRMGSANSAADALVSNPSITGATNVAMGYEAEIRRRSATTVRRLGKGTEVNAEPMAGQGTVMASAATVANMDSADNYLRFSYTKTGTAGTGTVNMIDVVWKA